MATAFLETIIREHVATGVGRVDRVAGVIHNVKVLGAVSLNGRRYSPEALRNAVGLYEGCKVAIDHPARDGRDRSVRDIFGTLRNVRLAGSEIRADLHYNTAHPMAEQVAWFAENNPGAIGLSHNAEGRTVQRDGHVVVEEITRVRSVDLVADPATTNGLFEARNFTQPVGSEDFARRILEGADGDVPPADSVGDKGELAALREEVLKILDRATSAKDLAERLLRFVDAWAKRQTTADPTTARDNGKPEPTAAAESFSRPGNSGDFAAAVLGGCPSRSTSADPRDDHDHFLETIRG